jgi:molybdate transport system regulatory protein
MELKWRFWFEKDGVHVMGKGGAEILQAIKKHGSIARAAKSLGMSYRFVWKYLKKIERVLDSAVVEKRRGGKSGGGTKLTPLGESLLRQYAGVERYLKNVSESDERLKIEDWQIRGVVRKIESNSVEIEVYPFKAVITKETVEELSEGDEVIIKISGVEKLTSLR